MPKEIEKKIAREFYVGKMEREDLFNRYHIRPKTLQAILAKYKGEFEEQ